MSEEKTHYRKVFKSDHLGVADLEEMIEEKKPLVFTISHVRMEQGTRVAGKKIDCNVAYFVGNVKPLVLNATNSKTMKQLTGSSFLEDWAGVSIALYIQNNIKFGNDVVDGVRISSSLPKAKYNLVPDCDKWETAKQRAKEGMTLDQFRQHYQLTDENYKLLCS